MVFAQYRELSVTHISIVDLCLWHWKIICSPLTDIFLNLMQQLYSIDRLKAVNNSLFDFFCVGVMYAGEYDVCDVTLSACIFTPDKLEKYAWPRWESNLRPLES